MKKVPVSTMVSELPLTPLTNLKLHLFFSLIITQFLHIIYLILPIKINKICTPRVCNIIFLNEEIALWHNLFKLVLGEMNKYYQKAHSWHKHIKYLLTATATNISSISPALKSLEDNVKLLNCGLLISWHTHSVIRGCNSGTEIYIFIKHNYMLHS